MKERGAPLLVGAGGLVVGVAAAFSSGALAGALAVVAGALAVTAGGLVVLTGSGKDRVAELEATATQHENDLTTAREELSDARRRIAELEQVAARAEQVAAEHAAVTNTSSLTEPESLLFSEAYFRVALDARIASARRHLRPVAIALIDVFEGLAGPNATPAPPERAAESIRQTVRDADTACRLSDGTYAIILEDTPENGAVWTVERVRRNMVSRFGSHTMWAGVACYPAHAFSTDELLTQARAALESAREWKQDRIEVAISE
jgi:diguanylate cyclase (GGDEF)-like protein